MPWVYIDDKFPEHPKVIAAGGDAGWLWLCALAYCNRNLTEGVIPKVVIPRLSDRKQPEKLAKKLCDVGLWEDKGDAYHVHDYDVHNQTAVNLVEKKKARSDRARKAAQARWHTTTDDAPSNAPSMRQASTEHATSNAERMPQAMRTSNAPSMRNDAPACASARAPLPQPLSTSLSTARELSNPPAREDKTNINFAPPDDPLVQRIATLLGGKPRHTGDAQQAITWARTFAAEPLIDEAIGRCEQANPPPKTIAYIRTTIERTATANGINPPEGVW